MAELTDVLGSIERLLESGEQRRMQEKQMAMQMLQLQIESSRYEDERNRKDFASLLDLNESEVRRNVSTSAASIVNELKGLETSVIFKVGEGSTVEEWYKKLGKQEGISKEDAYEIANLLLWYEESKSGGANREAAEMALLEFAKNIEGEYLKIEDLIKSFSAEEPKTDAEIEDYLSFQGVTGDTLSKFKYFYNKGFITDDLSKFNKIDQIYKSLDIIAIEKEEASVGDWKWDRKPAFRKGMQEFKEQTKPPYNIEDLIKSFSAEELEDDEPPKEETLTDKYNKQISGLTDDIKDKKRRLRSISSAEDRGYTVDKDEKNKLLISLDVLKDDRTSLYKEMADKKFELEREAIEIQVSQMVNEIMVGIPDTKKNRKVAEAEARSVIRPPITSVYGDVPGVERPAYDIQGRIQR